MKTRTRAVLVVMAWPFVAAAATPTATATPAATPTPTPTPTAAAAADTSWKERFSVELGWGYYEVTHAGLAYHFTDRAALDVFAGGGLAWDAKTISAGLGFRHHVGGPIKTIQAGWDVKALYWTQSDANYEWKNMSFVLGAYAVRELDRRLSLKLDAGVALTAALESDRKQNENFGSPQRWNASICLELVYRLGT
jgi:hypothetical protein